MTVNDLIKELSQLENKDCEIKVAVESVNVRRCFVEIFPEEITQQSSGTYVLNVDCFCLTK